MMPPQKRPRRKGMAGDPIHGKQHADRLRRYRMRKALRADGLTEEEIAERLRDEGLAPPPTEMPKIGGNGVH